MKKYIHPKYETAKCTCVCGNVIETRTTVGDIKIDICSKVISTLDMLTHHSIEADEDGIWTPITYIPSKNNPGLDESKGVGKSYFYDDGILKVSFDNKKIFEKSFVEILVETNFKKG